MTATTSTSRPDATPGGSAGTLRFPDGFVWGAATAAYQIEGAAHVDGRRDSIWDAFARVPGAVIDGHDGEVACDHYNRSADDVELMRSMSIGAYRFSTSWARIRPDGVSGRAGINQAGLDFYSRLVDDLLDKDILPWLTLYHWDLPQALEEKGGWTNRDTADLFTEYAGTVHDALGDRVKVWTTLNEPWCASFVSYTAGAHAPGRQSPADGLAAAHHLLLAHGQAVRELRSRDASLDLGITLNFTVADPVDPADAGDVDAARRIDAQINRVFTDPIFTGAYPVDLLEDLEAEGLAEGFLAHVRDGDLETISTPIDALGVNYYHGEAVSRTAPPAALDGVAPTERPTRSPYPAADGVHVHPRGLPTTAMGWEVQPEGLTRVLLRLQEHYTGPAGVRLYVTENGCAYDDVADADDHVDDQDRLAFYDVHLRAMHDAIEQGADVRGYFAWSLMDNFEWAWGYHKRFGIVRVNYETQTRTVKASGRWYADVARTNTLETRGAAPA